MGEAYQRWRVPPTIEILWEKWPEETVVYNTLSGETHYLNETATVILEMLDCASHGTESLAQALSDKLPSEEVEAAMQQIRKLLIEFDHLGLIEPAE